MDTYIHSFRMFHHDKNESSPQVVQSHFVYVVKELRNKDIGSR